MQKKYTEEQRKQIDEFLNDTVSGLAKAVRASRIDGDDSQVYHVNDGKPWPPELLEIAERNGRAMEEARLRRLSESNLDVDVA